MIRVLPDEVYRDYVAACSGALGDEGLAPGQVLDFPVYLAGADPGREDDHVVFGIESLVDKAGQFARLAAELVDGDAHRGYALDIHQKVVYQIFDLSVEARAEDAAEGDAVDASQGMVGCECETDVVAESVEVLHTFDVDGDVKRLHAVHAELDALVALFEETVDQVLVDEFLPPVDYETRYAAFSSAAVYDCLQVET